MKTYQANLLNSLTLIALSSFAYFSSDAPSNTTLIATVIGFALILCTNGIMKQNKIIAHIAVLLTFLAIVGLSMALKGSISRDEEMAILRIGVMILTSVLSMIVFIKSFIANRKNK